MAYVDLADIFDPAPDASPPAEWGDQIRDNFEALAAVLAGITGATVNTQEGTTSDTYTDLSTVGPEVSVETGDSAVVIVVAQMFSTSAGHAALMSHAVSGASSIAASDNWAATYQSPSATQNASVIGMAIHDGTLTPGTNVFTAKYRRFSAGTATFLRRKILVVPLL